MQDFGLVLGHALLLDDVSRKGTTTKPKERAPEDKIACAVGNEMKRHPSIYKSVVSLNTLDTSVLNQYVPLDSTKLLVE